MRVPRYGHHARQPPRQAAEFRFLVADTSLQRRSPSIPERFPIDSASLARQTQFGVHIRPKTVEIRGDSAVSGRVRVVAAH
jgi:hypothetical protein